MQSIDQAILDERTSSPVSPCLSEELATSDKLAISEVAQADLAVIEEV